MNGLGTSLCVDESEIYDNKSTYVLSQCYLLRDIVYLLEIRIKGCRVGESTRIPW